MAFRAFEKEIGFATAPVINPVVSSVGVSVATIFRQNANRVFWMVVNLGANVMYVGWDRAVSATRCMRAEPNGGIVSVAWREDYELCFQEVFALSSLGNLDVYCVELNVLGPPAAGGP